MDHGIDQRKYDEEVQTSERLRKERDSWKQASSTYQSELHRQQELNAKDLREEQERHSKALALVQKEVQDLEQRNRQLEDHIKLLQDENSRIQALHVKGVNAIGPGIEPISDKALAGRISGIQEDVSAYFRGTFKGKRIVGEIPEDIVQMTLKWRLIDLEQVKRISTGNLLELVFWDYMELMYFARWLPIFSEGDTLNVKNLERQIISAGK